MTDQMILAERLKVGDEVAFRHLFDEYYQALCLFAVNYLSDDAESADVVQECFIRYWDRRADFDHLMKVRSFLYTMVRNSCLNILRNDRRRQKRLEELSGELFFKDTLILAEDFKQRLHSGNICFDRFMKLCIEFEKIIVLWLLCSLFGNYNPVKLQDTVLMQMPYGMKFWDVMP